MTSPEGETMQMQPEVLMMPVQPVPPPTAAHILIAEDNPIARKLAVRQMERLGYAVDEAADGREAVEAFRRCKYDAVLMDCEMPEMNGYEATREIRRLEGQARRARIIAITAHEGESERQKCREFGMDEFVTKPLKPEAVAQIIAQSPGKAQQLSAAAAAPSGAQSEPILDREVIDELRDSDQELLDDLIDAFLQKIPARIDQLVADFARGDLNAASMNAHSLKGSAANLGARRMRAVCAALDMMARNGAVENVASLLADLRAEYRQASLALAAERSADPGEGAA
jgi:CheY-like chemotaxis protein/HPt (histidine-containing phosphotransfer) domain-containing protein